MVGPIESQGIEKGHGFTGSRIDSLRLVRLVKAAIGTLQDEVVDDCRAASGPWDDVIHVKGGPLPKLLEATVPTPSVVALKNVVSQRGPDI
jgi:hypothetical protein